MRQKDLQKMRGKSENELFKLIEQKLADLREKNIRTGKNLRRDVAQLKTILTEKKLMKGKEEK